MHIIIFQNQHFHLYINTFRELPTYVNIIIRKPLFEGQGYDDPHNIYASLHKLYLFFPEFHSILFSIWQIRIRNGLRSDRKIRLVRNP